MNTKMTFPRTVMILFLLLLVIFYGIFIVKAEPHIPLIGAIVILSMIARILGFQWDQLEKGILRGIALGLKPILILFLVGMIIGTWMMSGTVPTLLDFGFRFISPDWFFVNSLFITIVVSTVTGSSFTTIGTIGVALMGVGVGLGVNPAIAAGAIVSGACFGDKMSPLSDTTNFAPGVVNVDLFDHIQHMMWTTIPSLILTFILFGWLGINDSSTYSLVKLVEATQVLHQSFHISLWTLASPLVVIILAIKRVPTVPTLIMGILSGIIVGTLTQPQISWTEWFGVLQNGFSLETENGLIDGIVNRGGLQSMMWSASLIFIALALGGLIQAMNLFEVILEPIINRLKKAGSLITLTAFSSVGVNLLTGEQYLSILLPGQMFKDSFKKFGLHPKNLSRTLEDGGTLINPLIPWGVSGAFFTTTLGVDVAEYAPYAFFLFLSPMFTIIIGYLGIGVTRLKG